MWLELPMTRASRDIFESRISKLPISRWTPTLKTAFTESMEAWMMTFMWWAWVTMAVWRMEWGMERST